MREIESGKISLSFLDVTLNLSGTKLSIYLRKLKLRYVYLAASIQILELEVLGRILHIYNTRVLFLGYQCCAKIAFTN